ncbi:type IIL restriction-modification enzyme MmeI, partial [Limosilactobacillus reuteri subsp. suis]|uniref:type IIL restriction-modification enzyme MmeI n=1 Tax=Limosilactobacillus reuteri TaxID=1598 RepID=UPI003992B42E
PNTDLYSFGVLSSIAHNAWMRAVAGRLKSDYRYSKNVVYNNFPWPEVTDKQKETISKTAQGILDARKLYPDSSLADLYDPLTMPIDLRKAHEANDKAVLKAYGLKSNATEDEIVQHLFKMYEELTKGEN